jgi:hypothetical protein
LKKITEDGTISHAYGLAESTVKMAILPKAIYKCNSHQNPNDIHHRD